MKSENEKDVDGPLHRILRQWKVEDALPPRFGDGVWHRIELQQERKSTGVWLSLAGFLEALRRPALASTYVAFLLLLGIGAGYWHARMDNERATQELGSRYVQMMDPYQRAGR